MSVTHTQYAIAMKDWAVPSNGSLGCMYKIEVCPARQIVLIRFSGELDESQLASLDGMGKARQGGPSFDVVFDMTAVDKADIATDFIAKRGDQPPVFPDRERIFVVPRDDLRLLIRLFAGYQFARGWRSPLVVETLAEALLHLGVTESDFVPFAG